MAELPVLSDDPHERADAVRNRGKVLAAAERLFAEQGPCSVSMDAVAAAAGVGKGTLFRRFGDRAGLAQAVLSERERRFQEEFIRGPAPLGPGAPAIERLTAFGERLFQHLADHGDLITIAEAQGARYKAAPYGVYRAHVAMLVREADPGLRLGVHRRHAARGARRRARQLPAHGPRDAGGPDRRRLARPRAPRAQVSLR